MHPHPPLSRPHFKSSSFAHRPKAQETRRRQAIDEQRRRRTRLVDQQRRGAAETTPSTSTSLLGVSLDHISLEEEEEEEEEERKGKEAPEGAAVGDEAGHAQSSADEETADKADERRPAARFQNAREDYAPTSRHRRRRRPKREREHKTKQGPRRPSQFADVLMYAELLELDVDDGDGDGIPSDLETEWVALAPVPRGKRCLAFSDAGAGAARGGLGARGAATTLTLFSRQSGRPLPLSSAAHALGRGTFPAPFNLPTRTALDCVYDVEGKSPVLWVIDILTWAGRAYDEFQAEFRFYWRDAKLAELGPPVLPSHFPLPSSAAAPAPAPVPYPYILMPVPYRSPPLSIPTFLDTVLPAARGGHQLSLHVLVPPRPGPRPPPPRRRPTLQPAETAPTASMDDAVTGIGRWTLVTDAEQEDDRMMDADEEPDARPSLPPSKPDDNNDNDNDDMPTEQPTATLHTLRLPPLQTDGLLLYVKEATYVSGSTPLAVWVPADGWTTHRAGMGMDTEMKMEVEMAGSEDTVTMGGEGALEARDGRAEDEKKMTIVVDDDDDAHLRLHPPRRADTWQQAEPEPEPGHGEQTETGLALFERLLRARATRTSTITQ